MDRFRVLVFLIAIIALVAAGVVLKAAKGVILPLIFAWLLSYLFTPIVRFMEKKKVPTFLTIIVILALFLGFCTLGVFFMNTRILAFASAYPRYYDSLISLAQSLTANLDIPAEFWSGINWGQRIGAYLLSLSGSLVSLLSNLVLVIIFMVFILSGAPYYKYKVRKAFSETNTNMVINIIETISTDISRYLTLQFFISAVTGFLFWVVLEIAGVDFAITWGVFTFVLNFIPTIGSIIATIPPILLAVVQFYPSPVPAVVITVLLVAIQQVMGNVLSPKIMGDELNLSPVVILVSLLFWGWLWGIVGALLSVPMLSVIKIVCENIPPLHPISVMMGSGKAYRREFKNK